MLCPTHLAITTAKHARARRKRTRNSAWKEEAGEKQCAVFLECVAITQTGHVSRSRVGVSLFFYMGACAHPPPPRRPCAPPWITVGRGSYKNSGSRPIESRRVGHAPRRPPIDPAARAILPCRRRQTARTCLASPTEESRAQINAARSRARNAERERERAK